MIMKPYDFRNLLLKEGTKIGLRGDYSDPSVWTHGNTLHGILNRYIIVQRYFNLLKPSSETELDAAVIATSFTPLQSVGYNHKGEKQAFYGDQFLLILRSEFENWNNLDPSVHVYGWLEEAPSIPILSLNKWHTRTLWLASAATMILEEPENFSEIAILIQQEQEVWRISNESLIAILASKEKIGTYFLNLLIEPEDLKQKAERQNLTFYHLDGKHIDTEATFLSHLNLFLNFPSPVQNLLSALVENQQFYLSNLNQGCILLFSNFENFAVNNFEDFYNVIEAIKVSIKFHHLNIYFLLQGNADAFPEIMRKFPVIRSY